MRTKSFRLGKTEAIRVAIAGVTSIGGSAFFGCKSLTSVTFKDTSTWYYTDNDSYNGGTVVDVTDSGTNATKLKDTYCSYYWYKAE